MKNLKNEQILEHNLQNFIDSYIKNEWMNWKSKTNACNEDYSVSLMIHGIENRERVCHSVYEYNKILLFKYFLT